MLFTSIGLEITPDCIGGKVGKLYCVDDDSSLTFMINGKYHADVMSYEIRHNDRILISFGELSDIEEQLEYVESLEIYDIPKKDKITPGKDILI